MSRYWIAAVAFVGSAPFGCTIDYRADMKLGPDGLTQHVSVSDSKSTPSTDQRKTFKPGTSRTGTIESPTEAAGRIPADLGTDPNWVHNTSPLGEAWVLSIPRGGDVSVADGIRSLQKTVDVTTEQLATWFEKRYTSTAWGPKAANVCRTDLRRDLTDLTIMLWGLQWNMQLFDMKDVMERAEGKAELKAYVDEATSDILRRGLSASAAFLSQRNWISLDAASLMIAAGDVANLRDDPPSIGIMTAVGVSALERLMQRLDMHDEHTFWALAMSVGNAMERDKLNDTVLKAIQDHIRNDPYVLAAMSPILELLTSFDTESTLHIGDRGKPAYTNGTLDKGKQSLEWAMKLNPWSPGLATPPILWTSAWARPDTQAQRKIFGDHFVLDGTDLVAFTVAWNAASDAGRTALLDAFDAKKVKPLVDEKADDVLEQMAHLLMQLPAD